MAPRPVANPKKSAANYRKNPKSAAKKAAYDKKFMDTPARRAYKAELDRERRKRGIRGEGGGDLSHTRDGRLVRENASKNRARNRGKK